MNPKVSVIVPNYNHARYLNQRIDSILNQTYQDFELILLDDCSTDNSREVLMSYKDNPHVSHIVFNEQNAGTAFRQWNKGIALAKGQYIWIAESDDWAETDFLETVMNEIAQHPECGLAYTLAHYMQDGVEQWPLNASGKVTAWSGADFVRNKLVYGCVIYNVSMVVFRRDLFDMVDQSLYAGMHLCGDWFFYAQLCEHTGVLQIDAPHSFYRMHRTNVHNSAEHEGLTFLEGLRVINYMARQFHIPQCVYARHWGRNWVKYRKKYMFSCETNRKIKQQAPLSIRLWHAIYCVRKWSFGANGPATQC